MQKTIHLRNKEIEKIIRDEISMRFAVFAKQPEKKKQKVEEMYKVLEYIKELEDKIKRICIHLWEMLSNWECINKYTWKMLVECKECIDIEKLADNLINKLLQND